MRTVAALLAAAAIGAAALAAAGSFHTGRLLLVAGLPGAAAAVFDDPAWRGVALLRAGRPDEAAAALRQSGSVEAAYNLGNALAALGDLDGAVRAYDLALLRDPDDADAKANRSVVEAARAAARAKPADGGDRAGLANSGSRIEHDAGADDTDTADDSGVQSALGDGMVGNREAGSTTSAEGSSKVGRKGAARDDDSAGGAGSTKGSATDAAGRAGRGGGATDVAESEAPPPGRKAAEPGVDETRQATLQWLAAIPDDPGRFLKLRIAIEHERRLREGTAARTGGEEW
ncbi:tetratricopeptide repeat protein [Oharaeibacter diazotrophicus]|uniref:Tetratricopeptide repeat protein n=2 Tax=Oharaeibacter diazotrophicus TaxID=1920512 RepID=A0A4R6RKL1_9HYPH|nr:tetratricopeptide repeat protein [Oharaeibacter diazotrophicus]TDP86226.1 tetratricopeptide repeat protein [Oharaeibacter diazotrophicus]BBE71832.1 tetratricopeptide repeat protein [Pleomorphomonas sp. SM30]GLS78597.1 hypothetical protein GCM10007904_39340 [Oharaeibacter diazotrophicus]